MPALSFSLLCLDSGVNRKKQRHWLRLKRRLLAAQLIFKNQPLLPPAWAPGKAVGLGDTGRRRRESRLAGGGSASIGPEDEYNALFRACWVECWVEGLGQQGASGLQRSLNSSGLGQSPSQATCHPPVSQLFANPWRSAGNVSGNPGLWAGQEVNQATSPFWKAFSKTLYWKPWKRWIAGNQTQKAVSVRPALPGNRITNGLLRVFWRVMGSVLNPQWCP